MLIKAMVPQLWDVSLGAPYTPDSGNVIVTRVQKPQAAWVYRGDGWAPDAENNIPKAIRKAAEDLFHGD